MFNIKKIDYSKKGSRWIEGETKNVSFKNYQEANQYYTNVVNDDFGKTRIEYGYSQYGGVSTKTFYSPDNKEKLKYVF